MSLHLYIKKDKELEDNRSFYYVLCERALLLYSLAVQ